MFKYSRVKTAALQGIMDSRLIFTAFVLMFSLALWLGMSTALFAASFNNSIVADAGRTGVNQARQSLSATGAPVQQEVKQLAPADMAFGRDTEWRVRIYDAAVVEGSMVLLGEIAAPVGPMPEPLWQKLAGQELWVAPGDNAKPVNLTRPRLQQAMVDSMGRDFAALCLYPPSITLQRGGKVLDAATIQQYTVKTLTPMLAVLPGEVSLSDFRLPANVFLDNKTQSFELEAPVKVTPGRLSLRYSIKELDGSVVRRVTGTVFVDCWATVPSVIRPVNKGDVIRPENITFVKKNLAYVRGDTWDGVGGPWQAQRAISIDQPVMMSDLSYIPTVKKGALLKLVFVSGSVRLSVTVEALADGVSGETIPVRNVQSKRMVYATIYDANTVTAQSSSVSLSQAAPVNISDISPDTGKRGAL